jgi:hypothetical protein
LAVVLGVVTAFHPSVAAACVSVIALGALLLPTARLSRPVDLAGKRFRWVTFAWAFVLIAPIGHFTAGRTLLTAVAGVPSVENVINLAIYALIAALAAWSMVRNRIGQRPPWLLGALPALALLSAAWSLAPTVTLGFSFELVVVGLLAWLTGAILHADLSLGRSLVCRTLRVTVLGVALLCVIGLVFRSGWTPSDPNGGALRFSWPGSYPLWAGAVTGFALLVVVFAGRREVGLSWPTRAVLLGLFGACTFLANTRTTFFGLAVAGLFGYWFVSKRSGPLRRLAGAAAIGLTVYVIVQSFGGPITQYLYRGETAQQVYALNGRVPLWTQTLQQVHSPGRWLFGYGLGGGRVLFAASSTFAGDAHGAWLELLLSMGIVGALIGATVVAALIVRLFRAAPGAPLPSRLLPILFVYVLAMSPAASGFALPGPEPGLGFASLALFYAATAARERASARAVARHGARRQADLRPVPI